MCCPSQPRRRAEAALGAPIDAVFAGFETEPFAAASIAQVHGAVLPDGRAVIVKVRRPGIVEQIDRELRLAMLAARVASALLPAIRRYRPVELIDEVWRNLKREADFRLEARNARRLVEGFARTAGHQGAGGASPRSFARVFGSAGSRRRRGRNSCLSSTRW